MADRAADIGFSQFRGERIELADGIVLVNDCYNANPVSMRAALDHLATLGGAAHGRRARARWASSGPAAPGFHREVGAHARAAGIDLVVGVGAPAREYDPDELVADPGEAAEWLAAHLEARRRGPDQGLALGRAWRRSPRTLRSGARAEGTA